ncbi:hypothetical protein ACWD3J_40955 [Streptomyces sp. NPDC002755]|uniref:hypothetical protein n=1 Tax=Streptomyces sp. NPDC002884 TaxID=3154544 RepID=UPI003326C411
MTPSAGSPRGSATCSPSSTTNERALRAAHLVIILVGALWTRSRPAPSLLAAFQADSSLAFMHPAFAEAFEAAIATFLRGLIVGSADAT